MKRIMIDAEKCDGCKNCSIACMQAHQNKGNEAGYFDIFNIDLEDKGNEARHTIKAGKPNKYIPVFCRHCDKPECELACMSGALYKDDKTGNVHYNPDQCDACFMCVMSCPYGVPRPDMATKTVVIRCDFCQHDPSGPNCVRACPTKAITIAEV